MQGEVAYIFYFTHPGRDETGNTVGLEGSYESRRSSIQAARLDGVDGVLVCDRNELFEIELLPEC
ncbi:hypothetical protein D3C79_1058770 [compost metagenome]